MKKGKKSGQEHWLVTRRKFLERSAAGLATISAAGLGPWVTARAADTLIVNFYGGEVSEIFKRTTIQPFEKKFGVKVVYDDVGSSAEDYAKIRASKGHPGFDVAAGLTVPEIILGAKEGLLEKIDESNVPNSAAMWDLSRSSIPPYGIVQHLQFTTLYYNKDKISAPTSWRDYWQPGTKYDDELKGHVLQVKPGNILCIFALMMGARISGGSTENMDPAFKLLEEQKPWIGVVEQSSSKMAPYFENEEVWLSPYWSARAGVYIERGFPMEMVIPEEGTLLLPVTGAVPVGSTNKKLAFEFLNFRLSPEVQREFCLAYHVSPGRKDMGDWPADFAKRQITTEKQMAAMIMPDYDQIAAQRKDWSLRWQKIMAA